MLGYDHEERQQVSVGDALQSLPLFDDPFLRMQAINLTVIDEFLLDWEHRLLAEYIKTERTPLQTAVFVSALSQLWIFGLYELLRTWRQRAREVIRFAEEIRALTGAERKRRIVLKNREVQTRAPDLLVMAFHWPVFARAARSKRFAETLSKAVDRSERLFRRIEALRVSLAKHEIPKSKRAAALAPGYGRIDTPTGSICWQILLGGNEVDIVSRRAISDGCRELGEDRSLAILPLDIQEKIARIPKYRYGGHRVSVKLQEGREYGGVHVAWTKEVMFVEGHKGIPFDASQVIDVGPDPLKGPLPARAARPRRKPSC